MNAWIFNCLDIQLLGYSIEPFLFVLWLIMAVMGQVAAPLNAAERRLAKDQQAQAKILAAQQEELRLSEVQTTTTLESGMFE